MQRVNVRTNLNPNQAEESAVAAAARAGDEPAFAELARRYRYELQVHCYRILGSYDDSEDMVQETFLRAWRRRETYETRSTFRAWLYRVATNACLDFLDHFPHARQAGSRWSVEAPPAALQAALASAGIRPSRFTVQPPGGVLVLPAEENPGHALDTSR